MRTPNEPKNTADKRYDLPREKIKDTGGEGHFFTPKRLHKDSTHARTHARTKRNDFPVGWAKLPPPTSDTSLGCVMLCYPTLCYAVLRYAVQCYAVLWHAVLYYAVLCHAVLSWQGWM